MDQILLGQVKKLQSKDADERYAAYKYVINLTKEPVDWAYQVWDDMLQLLHNGDNHQRSIAAQVLSSLAKSDPEERMLKDLHHLIAATKDEMFVTARHSLQSLWMVAVASDELKKKVVDQLSKRFNECTKEKNSTLVRYDILEVFRKIYNEQPDEKLKNKCVALIDTEEDPKYKKKYAGLWKDLMKVTKAKK